MIDRNETLLSTGRSVDRGGSIAGASLGRLPRTVQEESMMAKQRAEKIGEATPLQLLASRIHDTRHRLTEMLCKLHEHADRVHGPTPETTAGEEERDRRSGQLGAVFDALDELENTVQQLPYAVQRTTGLA